MLQEVADEERRVDHAGPFDIRPRIEIKDDPIGPLDVVGPRLPGMNLQHAELHQGQKTLDVFDKEVDRLCALRWILIRLTHGGRPIGGCFW